MKVATHDTENYIILNEIKSSNPDKNDMLLINAADGSFSFAHGVVENENGMSWDNKVKFQDEVQNLPNKRSHRKK